MEIHYFQHVPFEDSARIAEWAGAQGHKVTATRFFLNEEPPSLENWDGLVVMGGPMGTYDEKKYAWLVQEKRYLEKALQTQKPILGICLGAQLLAEVLGARVRKNKHREIGWFPVRNVAPQDSFYFQGLPREFMAFHWHGDTFDLPPGASHLAQSEACLHQAFEWKEHVLGLQFHLESSAQSVERLVRHCRHEITPSAYVQSESQILKNQSYLRALEPSFLTLMRRFSGILTAENM